MFLQVEPWRLWRGLWVLLLGKDSNTERRLHVCKVSPALRRSVVFKKKKKKACGDGGVMPRADECLASPAANRVKRTIWLRAKHCGKYVKFLFPFLKWKMIKGPFLRHWPATVRLWTLPLPSRCISWLRRERTDAHKMCCAIKQK